jgi:asparagine synthase (glutamine-hydrolysing)
MCGIFGFIGPPDAGLAARMAGYLRHRGPDDEGTLETKAITLGVTRLAIVGVEDGHQPFASEDGEVILVANGEIYNHRELRAELERRGHRFRTQSDCEVIAHLYEELGEGALERLDGMFSFALWDAGRSRLLLARDRAGMKPLFYAEHAGRFLFASEAKAILGGSGMPRRVDPRALDAVLALGVVPGEGTMFSGVNQVPPAHLLTIDPGGRAVRPYWRLVVRGRRPIEDPARALERRLLAAVESHLATEVPQAFALSGGLDSSLVVAMARRILDRPIRTFSLGSVGAGDERRFARVVAEHCRTDHLEIELDPADLVGRLAAVVWHVEAPQLGPMAANDLMFERIAREAKVVHVGEGADELFGGYDRIKTVAGPLAWLPGALGRRAYLGRSALVAGRGRVYRPDFLASLARPRFGEVELAGVFATTGTERREALLGFEQGVLLPPSHLRRIDRLTMAHSIEARLPFLDRALVELANRLPDAEKIRFRGEKRVLREAARGYLPERIRLRPKYGMRESAGVWQASGMLELARELLGESALQRRGYFRERYVRRLLDRVGGRRSRPFASRHLQLLVAIEVFHRTFIDPERLEAPLAGRRPPLSSPP